MKRGAKPGSKIDQLRKNVELLTLRMQFFHLDPKYENYKEITENVKLCNEQSNVIEVWKNACIAEYGDIWDMFNPTFPKEQILLKYAADIQRLMKRFEQRPTSTLLDQIWYIFFATGDYNFLRTGFEAAGHPNSSKGLREDALTMFETIKNQYSEKITEAKQHDPNYFVNSTISNVRNAPLRWEELDKEIQGKMTEIGETNDDEINELLADDKKLKEQYKFVSDVDAKKTPEELEAEKQINKGVDVFNRILNDINTSEKLKRN